MIRTALLPFLFSSILISSAAIGQTSISTDQPNGGPLGSAPFVPSPEQLAQAVKISTAAQAEYKNTELTIAGQPKREVSASELIELVTDPVTWTVISIEPGNAYDRVSLESEALEATLEISIVATARQFNPGNIGDSAGTLSTGLQVKDVVISTKMVAKNPLLIFTKDGAPVSVIARRSDNVSFQESIGAN